MTRSAGLYLLFSLAVTPSIVTVEAAQQAVARSAEEFKEADAKTKSNTLNSLAAHRLNVPPTDLVEVVLGSLLDPSPQVRRRALGVIAGRAGAVRFGPTDEKIRQWKSERPFLLSLRQLAMQLLDDTDELVRRDAIIALGNLEYQLGAPATGIQPPIDLLERFAARFDKEPSPVVRMELAKAFALLPNSVPVQRSVLLRALDDSSEDAVQYAVVGVGKLRIGSALPRLVELLTHENRAVRLAVAAALSNYGPEARPYLPLLQSALESEGDPTVLKALEATVVRVDR